MRSVLTDLSPLPRHAGAPLLSLLLLLGLGSAQARVRLGELLPPHPWQSQEREVVVIYTHDCGDLGPLWQAVIGSGLPVRAVRKCMYLEVCEYVCKRNYYKMHRVVKTT